MLCSWGQERPRAERCPGPTGHFRGRARVRPEGAGQTHSVAVRAAPVPGLLRCRTGLGCCLPRVSLGGILGGGGAGAPLAKLGGCVFPWRNLWGWRGGSPGRVWGTMRSPVREGSAAFLARPGCAPGGLGKALHTGHCGCCAPGDSLGYGAGGAGDLKQNNVFPRVCWYYSPPSHGAGPCLQRGCPHPSSQALPKLHAVPLGCGWATLPDQPPHHTPHRV